MLVLAIDPGNMMSAWVLYDSENHTIRGHDKQDNDILVKRIWGDDWPDEACPDQFAIEMIACYGMPVGKTVFDTCVWIGRFIEAWAGGPHRLVYRSDVKMHLCHSMRAKDPNVRQALIDRFGRPGTKRDRGITYGIAGDEWAALGVAVTFAETATLFEAAQGEGAKA